MIHWMPKTPDIDADGATLYILHSVSVMCSFTRVCCICMASLTTCDNSFAHNHRGAPGSPHPLIKHTIHSFGKYLSANNVDARIHNTHTKIYTRHMGRAPSVAPPTRCFLY